MSGLIETDVRIGDHFRVEKPLPELTMPRMPCFKFGIKLGSARALPVRIGASREGLHDVDSWRRTETVSNLSDIINLRASKRGVEHSIEYWILNKPDSLETLPEPGAS